MPLSCRSKLISALHIGMACLFAALSSVSEAAETTIYKGSCDGSGAATIGKEEFVNADDDENTINIYRIGNPEPIWSLNIDAFLKAPAKKSGGLKEADLEGAARVGERVYWISSHGRDGKGNVEPGRARFFATDIVNEGGTRRLKPVGTEAYQGLRDALLADPKFKDLKLRDAYRPDEKKGPAPESDAGFNIEGLASTGDGRLLIGFRNPRPGGKTLLIPLENPAAIVDSGKSPEFGQPILLNLEGRGVRSIDRLGARYLIVAGPHGTVADSKIAPPFAIYTWTGPGSEPSKVPGLTVPAGFAPEASIIAEDGSRILLLSDDGDRDGCKGRDRGQKQFRALRIEIPG